MEKSNLSAHSSFELNEDKTSGSVVFNILENNNKTNLLADCEDDFADGFLSVLTSEEELINDIKSSKRKLIVSANENRGTRAYYDKTIFKSSEDYSAIDYLRISNYDIDTFTKIKKGIGSYYNYVCAVYDYKTVEKMIKILEDDYKPFDVKFKFISEDKTEYITYDRFIDFIKNNIVTGNKYDLYERPFLDIKHAIIYQISDGEIKYPKILKSDSEKYGLDKDEILRYKYTIDLPIDSKVKLVSCDTQYRVQSILSERANISWDDAESMIESLNSSTKEQIDLYKNILMSSNWFTSYEQIAYIMSETSMKYYFDCRTSESKAFCGYFDSANTGNKADGMYDVCSKFCSKDGKTVVSDEAYRRAVEPYLEKIASRGLGEFYYKFIKEHNFKTLIDKK